MDALKMIARKSVAVAVVTALGLAALVSHAPRHTQAASSFISVTASAPIQAAGLTETWTVRGIDPLGTTFNSVNVTFSAEFTVPASPVVTVTGGATPCTVTSARTTLHVVSITISGDCYSSRGLAITIAGVTNPTSTNAYNVSLTTNNLTLAATAYPAIWSARASANPAGSVDADGVSTVAVTFTPNRSAENTGSLLTQVLTIRVDNGATIPSALTGAMLAAPNPTQVVSPTTSVTANVAAGINPSRVLEVTVQAPHTPAISTVTLQATPVGSTQPVTIAATTIIWRTPIPTSPAWTLGSIPLSRGTRSLTTVSGTFEFIVRLGRIAGCDIDTIWANNPAGGFLIYVVNATIGAVNAAAVVAYPNGMKDNSPVIISCR